MSWLDYSGFTNGYVNHGMKEPQLEFTLESLRREIDRIDNNLLQMLQKRLEVARLVVKFKRESQVDINVPSREAEILNSLMGRERSLLSSQVIEDIYKIIFTESKRLQREAQPLVAFEGEHGAFSEMAARNWNREVVPVPCSEFTQVFRGVANGSYDYGIVPLENTVGGMSSQVNGYLLGSELYIVGAVEMSVCHCLLVVPGTDYRQLRRVYSHPVALTECQRFIRLMRLEAQQYYDTAAAAKMLAETLPEGAAAIAGTLAAKYYNLEVVQEEIGDTQNTRTRFLIFSARPREDGTGNKCSITFVTENRSGALHSILKLFAERNINLTRVDSLPDSSGNYAFFVDFMGGQHDEKVCEVLDQLGKYTVSYRFMGCYDELCVTK